jgi:hypothetical protein
MNLRLYHPLTSSFDMAAHNGHKNVKMFFRISHYNYRATKQVNYCFTSSNPWLLRPVKVNTESRLMTDLAAKSISRNSLVSRTSATQIHSLTNEVTFVNHRDYSIIRISGLITHRAMETYEGEEAQFHAFWTSLLDGSWVCTASITCERAPCVSWVGSPSPCEWGLRTEIMPKPVTESQTRQSLSL